MKTPREVAKLIEDRCIAISNGEFKGVRHNRLVNILEDWLDEADVIIWGGHILERKRYSHMIQTTERYSPLFAAYNKLKKWGLL